MLSPIIFIKFTNFNNMDRKQCVISIGNIDEVAEGRQEEAKDSPEKKEQQNQVQPPSLAPKLRI